jgi:transposase
MGDKPEWEFGGTPGTSPPSSGGISDRRARVRYIGVDLAKRSFTVCFLEEDDSSSLSTYPMTAEGLGVFREQLSADDRLAVEVGTNAYFFHDQVQAAVAEVVLVSTYHFAVIAKSKKKTDRGDALLLARFLKLDYLPRVVMPEPRVRELRHLFTAREALVNMARGLKNMGHAALARNGIAVTRAAFATDRGRQRLARLEGLAPVDRQVLDMVLRQLDSVDGEVQEIERAIIRVGKSLPGLKRVLQVRGLGLVAGIGLLSEIGDIKRFDGSKQLVSYAGLATTVRQSGNTDHRGHITKQGRARLRGFLVEAVLSMVRNPADRRTPLVDFYQRKKAEKGAGKAICATARKLLTVLFTMLSKDLDYWFLEERLYQKKLKQLGPAA